MNFCRLRAILAASVALFSTALADVELALALAPSPAGSVVFLPDSRTTAATVVMQMPNGTPISVGLLTQTTSTLTPSGLTAEQARAVAAEAKALQTADAFPEIASADATAQATVHLDLGLSTVATMGISTTPGTVASGAKACNIAGATGCSGATAIPHFGLSVLTMAQTAGQTIRPEVKGAYGDGAFAPGSGTSKPYVTIATGSTSLQVAYGFFAAADVGKYIEVGGAGALGVETAAPLTAGSGYKTGDTVLLAGGTFTRAATLTYTSQNAGTWTVTDPGAYSALPSSPASPSSTSGSGTGATFTLTSAVAPLRGKIASIQSSTQATLDTAASTAVAGAFQSILYGHDDTAAVQAAINAGRFVELTGGKTYLVRNLVESSYPPFGTTSNAGMVSRNGQAIVRAIPGADATYMVATPNWLSNNSYSDNPVLCRNVTFDGGGIVRDAVTNQSYGSTYDQCFFRNARRFGYYGTRTTQDGTALQNTTENTQFDTSGADSNGGDGIHIDAGLTDTQIRGGYYFNNGGYGIYAGTAAGMLVSGVHTYSNGSVGGGGATTGGAGMAGLYADSYGYGSSVVNSVFEDGVRINSLSSSAAVGTFGPGDTIGTQLGSYFQDNTNYEAFRSLGNTYIIIGSGYGSLYQGYNGYGHTVITESDNFQGGGVRWAGGLTSQGRIVARNSYARGSAFGNTGMALLDGLLIPTNVNPAPTSFQQVKNLSNTGTTTTYTITGTFAAAGIAGFTASGTLDVWSLNSINAIENYTVDLRIEYMRTTGTTSVKAVQLLNPQSTGTSVSAAATISDTTTSNSNNSVTVTIIITHPQAADQYSSSAILSLNSRNRFLTDLIIH